MASQPKSITRNEIETEARGVIAEIQGMKAYSRVRETATALAARTGRDVNEVIYDAACRMVEATVPHHTGIIENWSVEDMLRGVKKQVEAMSLEDPSQGAGAGRRA